MLPKNICELANEVERVKEICKVLDFVLFIRSIYGIFVMKIFISSWLSTAEVNYYQMLVVFLHGEREKNFSVMFFWILPTNQIITKSNHVVLGSSTNEKLPCQNPLSKRGNPFLDRVDRGVVFLLDHKCGYSTGLSPGPTSEFFLTTESL